MPDLIDESSTFLSLIGQKSNVDVLTSVNIYRSTRNVSDELERKKGNTFCTVKQKEKHFLYLSNGQLAMRPVPVASGYTVYKLLTGRVTDHLGAVKTKSLCFPTAHTHKFSVVCQPQGLFVQVKKIAAGVSCWSIISRV